jgi:hypothetical protein
MGFKTDILAYKASLVAGTTLLIDFRGQSNCSGAADNVDFTAIDATLTAPLPGCKVYNNGAFETLDAGVNNKLNVATQQSGLELQLMKNLQSALGEDVYMVKTDYSGTQLAQDNTGGVLDWSPLSTGEHFDTGNTRLAAAVDLMIAAELIPRIAAPWFQAENDANNAGRAAAYEVNLRRYINRYMEFIQDYMRTNHPTVRMPYVKFCIQEILTVANGNNTTVRTAQAAVAASNPHYLFRANTGFTSPDTVHLDAASYNLAGSQWATDILTAWD